MGGKGRGREGGQRRGKGGEGREGRGGRGKGEVNPPPDPPLATENNCSVIVEFSAFKACIVPVGHDMRAKCMLEFSCPERVGLNVGTFVW
jgi:hypothetical protein